MKLDRLELKIALKELYSSVERKDQSQITSYVFCESTDTGIKLITTDSEVYTEISIVVDSGLNFDVNFKDLKKFVDSLKSDTIEISIEEAGVKFVSNDRSIILSQYEINEEDLTKYDLINNFEIIQPIVYNHDIKLNESVFNAIDTYNPKFELNGLLVDFRAGKVVSTDTWRLAIDNIESLDIDSIIIPKKSLKKNSVISDIKIGDHTLHYTLDGIKKMSKLINGRYPDYERIVPQNNILEIKINGLELKDKLKGMKDSEMTFMDNILTIKSLENNTKISLPCDFPSNIGFTMDINTSYLYESITDNRIEIYINSFSLPITLKNIDSDNIIVIMPIVINHDADDSKRVKLINEIISENNSTFPYSEVKKQAKRVNKDAIIAELKREIETLKSQNKSSNDDIYKVVESGVNHSEVKSQIIDDLSNTNESLHSRLIKADHIIDTQKMRINNLLFTIKTQEDSLFLKSEKNSELKSKILSQKQQIKNLVYSIEIANKIITSKDRNNSD